MFKVLEHPLFQAGLVGTIWAGFVYLKHESFRKQFKLCSVTELNDEYDYIIVGAGTAGCVLANRLSAGGKYTVALIERGGHASHESIETPYLWSSNFGSFTEVASYTTPQVHLDDRQVFVPFGNVIGGSSSINAMIYYRGQNADFQPWAEKFGLGGWSFNDLDPYFERLENGNKIVSFSNPEVECKIANSFIAACAENKIRHVNTFDKTLKNQCFFQRKIAIDSSGRRSSAVEYLKKDALDRENLTIKLETKVKKVVIENMRAIGVELMDGKMIRARKEVIICAGAFGSPHLLLVSGIGPKGQLESANIKCVHDLKGVGKNLHDHPCIYSWFECQDENAILSSQNVVTSMNMVKWKLQKAGSKFSSNLIPATAYITSSTDTKPTINFLLQAATLDQRFCDLLFRFKNTTPTTLSDRHERPGFLIATRLLHPKSRGQVTLDSGNPHDYLNIDMNYLAHEDDIISLSWGLQELKKIVNGNAFDGLIGHQLPFPPHIPPNNEASILKSGLVSSFNYCGTCKMGETAMDKLCVVNSHLQVYGIGSLRVCDASIIPEIPGGDINTTVLVIAEKLANDIIAEGEIK